MKDLGWEAYAGNFYNIVDMAMFVTYVTYFLLRMVDPASPLLELDQNLVSTLSNDSLQILQHSPGAGGSTGK